MEEIKITIEKNGELSVLHLKTDKSLFDIINAIGKLTKEDDDIETFIEKQLLLDGKEEYIYESSTVSLGTFRSVGGKFR